jgi:hypothetical protein
MDEPTANHDGVHKTPSPISLSDAELDALMNYARPLHQLDRDAFISSFASRLRSEPVIGIGTVNRIARELLASGDYRRQDTLAVGDRVRPSWHRIKNGSRGDE